MTKFHPTPGVPIMEPVRPAIAGLELWLRADTMGLNDGDAVGTWGDESGNARHATQGTAARKPTFRAAPPGDRGDNRPAVQFDGTDDLLVTAAPVMTAVDNWALICAAWSTANTFTSPLCNGDGNVGGYAIATTTTFASPRAGWLRGGLQWHDTGTTAASGVFHLYLLERVSGVTTLYRDGVALSPTFAQVPLSPTVHTRIGSHADSNPWPGYICEVMAITNMTATERAAVTRYFSVKYALGF